MDDDEWILYQDTHWDSGDWYFCFSWVRLKFIMVIFSGTGGGWMDGWWWETTSTTWM